MLRIYDTPIPVGYFVIGPCVAQHHQSIFAGGNRIVGFLDDLAVSVAVVEAIFL
jgi:hypothetical protein